MIGEKLSKYRILETLGSGSMGTVYKAEDPARGQVVAIKLVKSHILYDAEKRERFLQGLLAASEIKHSGICPLLEIGDENDDFFVVMPLLEGKTLAKHLRHKPLPWEEALDIALAAGDTLAAGHARGAVHRGLNPANIWLQKDGSPLLMDFGMARFTEIEEKNHSIKSKRKVEFADTVIPMGALAYMSPEQVRGDRVDYRTDIFSFGVVLYEMLSGRHPFEGRNSLSRMSAILEANPPAVNSRGTPLPLELDPILVKTLAKSPDDRYQSMLELLEELRAVREHGKVAVPLLEEAPAHPPKSSSAAKRIVMVVLLLLFFALLTYYVVDC